MAGVAWGSGPSSKVSAAAGVAVSTRVSVPRMAGAYPAVGVAVNGISAWLFMAEWAAVDSSALVLDASAWYVTGGYRIGAFTPYLTYAQLRTERPNEAGIPTTGLPPPLAQAAAALNAGLGAALDETRMEAHT